MKTKGARWLAGTLITGLLLTVTAGCGGGSTPSQTNKPPDNAGKAITLKFGHPVNDKHPYQLAALKFKEEVEKGTNGQVKIEIFPNGQLADERGMIEGMQVGTVDMAITSTGPMGGFVPKMGVFDLPFLFRDREHAYKVLDGKVGDQLRAELEKKGIVGLAWLENGVRHITNSKRPINKPEDLKGLKIRTMENKVHVESFKAIGVDATPMSWSEVFTALQQKTIDGQENPIVVVATQRVYEVQKYLALTGHFYSPSLIQISKQKWAGLTKEQQDVIAKAAKEAAALERKTIVDNEAKQIEELKAKNMEITTPAKELFIEAMKPVYTKFEGQFGKELIEEIRNTK